MFCENCGQKSTGSTRFCTSCGMPLGHPGQTEETMMPTRVPEAARPSSAGGRSPKWWPLLLVVAIAGVAAFAWTARSSQQPIQPAPVPAAEPGRPTPTTPGVSATQEQPVDDPTTGSSGVPANCAGMLDNDPGLGEYIVIWELGKDRTLTKHRYTLAEACSFARAEFGGFAPVYVLDSEEYEGRNINTDNQPVMWTPFSGPFTTSDAAHRLCDDAGHCNVRYITPCYVNGGHGDACGG